MILLNAFKCLSLSILSLPIIVCTIGTGLIFAFYIFSLAKNPEQSDILFNATMLGFAFIESFLFFIFIFVFIILFL